MRDLLFSCVIVALLIGGWLTFDHYSFQASEDLASVIDEVVIPLTEREEWDKARDTYNNFEKDWGKYRKTALIFLENEQINELDLCIARAEKYIEAKDVSNSAGELCSISKQLELLNQREKITVYNIL